MTIYKKAFQHNVRIDTKLSNLAQRRLCMAAQKSGLLGFVVRESFGYWNGELGPCLEIEFLSEEKLPPAWLRFVEQIKILLKRQCVLPSVQTIEKQCTCEE